MASKGRWSPTPKDWERIYWKRTLPRELGRLSFWPNRPTTDEHAAEWDAAKERATVRAQAIDIRHKRLKRRARRTAKKMAVADQYVGRCNECGERGHGAAYCDNLG